MSDPGEVHTPAQLAAALNALRGDRSYAGLVRANPALRRSTIGDLLSGRSVPGLETLLAFLNACGLEKPAVQPWLAARARAAELRRPSGASRVRDVSPHRLGVHPSIRVDSTVDGLPTYVPRDFDVALRGALTPGSFVLLRGGSSTGKTRALVEAVQAMLPDWWLVHPGDDAAVRSFAESPAPRTVLWLDEFQRYPMSPGCVRAMVGAGVVMVGTLWPDEYNCRIAARTPGRPDPYDDDRQVLRLAHVIDVPEAFTPAERRQAESLASDKRLRIALDSTDAGVTQTLAAGPELIRWWSAADTTDPRQCLGRAAITAALDARRVGARAPLTPAFLTAAIPAYLTATQRAVAPSDWLCQAIAYATTRLHGAAACLTPVGTGMGTPTGYLVADYLHQHARRRRRAEPLTNAVWQALVDHHPDDTLDLAESATRRGRPAHAQQFRARIPRVELLRNFLDGECHRKLVTAVGNEPQDRDEYANERLNALLASRGDLDELRNRADAGRPGAARHLIEALTAQGHLDALQAEMHAGTPLAADRVAALRSRLRYRTGLPSDSA
ncbi:hypothetical protein [Actinoplanes solisilvae]|uniref:hypothetical protein n=1 Tax=Actinoplanes solisilvae TaxID=2486853 RepID=UPI000FD83748|nr:hypothetical protein [Actinoplanes solisilvae]